MKSDQNFPVREDKVESLLVQKLWRHEQIDVDHASALLAELSKSMIWTVPILVERHSHVILDGHHRYWCACQLGLSLIPAIRVEYCDPGLTLETWRADFPVTIDDVLRAARTRALLPHKTSRHRFSRDLPGCRVPISALRGSVAA